MLACQIWEASLGEKWESDELDFILILVSPFRSPEEGNGNPLQYSCLENLMDGGIWRATVHVVTESNVTE